MLLSVNRISKSFEDRAVLSDVSFDIGEGEIVGFLGPNGAGKTTAIKIILGLLTPNAGEVYIDGLNVRTDFEKAIRNVGAIIETPELYGYLSGMDNLKVAARPYRVRRSRINEVVEAVGLSEQIGEKVRRYSLGMRQRLGIAQAMLHSPKLLILDDSMSALDYATDLELRRQLAAEMGDVTKIMISQRATSIQHADHILVMDDGKCVGYGTHDELLVQCPVYADIYHTQMQ